jgi:hypothetical protein
MRYHWGLGVGHLHTHQNKAASFSTSRRQRANKQSQEPEDMDKESDDKVGTKHFVTPTNDGGDDGHETYDSDDPEFSLEERDRAGWESEEEYGSQDSEGE